VNRRALYAQSITAKLNGTGILDKLIVQINFGTPFLKYIRQVELLFFSQQMQLHLNLMIFRLSDIKLTPAEKF